jgi:hypothetical protein
MSFETISQGEDGSSHFVVAGIAYTLLTRKEWKKRRRHGRGRRRRCRAHEITVLLEFYVHQSFVLFASKKRVRWRCGGVLQCSINS